MSEEIITESVTFEEVSPESVAERARTARTRALMPYTAFLQAGWELGWAFGTYSNEVCVNFDDYKVDMSVSYRDDECDHESGYTLEVNCTDFDGLDLTYVYRGISAVDALAYADAIKQDLDLK